MLTNTPRRYGTVAKLLHWTVFALLVNQFVVAGLMLSTEEWETTAGYTQAALYEWHKSVGVVVFVVVLARFLWRKLTPLPDWAPNLSSGERRAIHYVERLLYVCLFVMPVSGFLFVMAGNFPLNFFGMGDLPNVVGEHPALSKAAEWTHYVTAMVLPAAFAVHLAIAFFHEQEHLDGYVRRMLPFTHQDS
jgi:cytochrome b561